MPIARFSELSTLISSLSKSEKRHFKLYAQRIGSNKNGQFLQLFEAVIRFPELGEDQVLAKLKGISNKSQFVNLKRHLFSQILKSLKLLYEERDPALQMKQRLDQAYILYRRGMHVSSLDLMKRAISGPSPCSEVRTRAAVTDLQKQIYSLHSSFESEAPSVNQEIIRNSDRLHAILEIENRMTSLNLELKANYNSWGYVRNAREDKMLRSYFESKLPELTAVSISPLALLDWHRANISTSLRCLEFGSAHKHAVAAISIMDEDKQLISDDPDLYIKCIHHMMVTTFYLGQVDLFNNWFEKYKTYRRHTVSQFDKTTALIDFYYYNNAEVNFMLINNKLKGLRSLVSNIEFGLADKRNLLGSHKARVLIFKVAILYTYDGDYDAAITYLNKVLDRTEAHSIRSDLHSYSLLLLLYNHYRSGNLTLVTNLLPSVKSNFERHELLTEGIEIMLGFLRKGCRAMNFGISELIDSTIQKLMVLYDSRYDKIIYLYFDHVLWLQSIKTNIAMKNTKSE